MSDLAERLLAGDRRALARAITAVESGGPARAAILRAVHGHGGRAQVVGITGAPGAGKSTLVAQLGGALRDAGEQVGVLAVDPSSPFSGGALLGDRVRMGAGEGLFIRSLASRGHLGGLSRACGDIVRLMDAAGFSVVLLETVGAGQGEVEVMRLAHTTVVVTVPGLGDDVQAFKAGILEIGDVFVVNKKDIPGADRTARDLIVMLEIGGAREPGWRPPVVRTCAVTGEGVPDLVAAVGSHRRHLVGSGRWAAQAGEQARRAFEAAWRDEALRRLEAAGRGDGLWEAAVAAVEQGAVDPYTAAEQLAERMGLPAAAAPSAGTPVAADSPGPAGTQAGAGAAGHPGAPPPDGARGDDTA